MRSKRIGLRSLVGLMASAAALAVSGAAFGVSGAVSTTHNPGHVDVGGYAPGYENGPCLNGQGVNCNIYTDKRDVWFSGLPVSAAVGAGTYFFAVLSPGGQPAPNDGGTNNAHGEQANLSDNIDAYTNRTFTVDGLGNITAYTGTHERDGNLLQLYDYADTPNNGGVYILAVCSLAGGYPVSPRDCKYDAFKIKSATEQEEPLTGPSVAKDASGSYDNTFTWSLQKCLNDISVGTPPPACRHTTTLNPTGTSVSVSYYVFVSHNSGAISNVKVTGNIQVFNGNVDDQSNTIPIDISNLTDVLAHDSTTTDCTILDAANSTPSFPVSLSAFETDFTYSCDLGTTIPSGEVDNTATVSWDDQTVGTRALDAGSSDFTFSDVAFTEHRIGNCTSVYDAFNGATPPGDLLGQACVGDSNPKKFTNTRSITVQQAMCVSYPNIATESANGSTDTDTVSVCGRIGNGFTIGFWSNNNGQAVLCAHDTAWRTLLNGSGNGYFLRTGSSGALYSVPTGGTCKAAQANFAAWLLGASATNMSYMLSAQLSGTMLNVAYKNMNGNACIAGINGNPISINNLIAGAITFLKANGITIAAGAARTTATLYKNIFDGLNNNLVNAVPGPC